MGIRGCQLDIPYVKKQFEMFGEIQVLDDIRSYLLFGIYTKVFNIFIID